MAWTTPRTWVAGELVTAALFNTHIRDNENILKVSLANDGSLASTGGLLTTPEFKGYLETFQTVSIASSAISVNAASGNHVKVNTTGNITAITLTGLPTTGQALTVLAYYVVTTTPSTVTHVINGHAVKFPQGVTPPMTTASTANSGKIDKFAYTTYDLGATFTGDQIGQGYTT